VQSVKGAVLNPMFSFRFSSRFSPWLWCALRD